MFETLQEFEQHPLRRWAPPLAAIALATGVVISRTHLPPRFVPLDAWQIVRLAASPVLLALLTCLLPFLFVMSLARAHQRAWLGVAALRWSASAIWLAPLAVFLERQSPRVAMVAAVLVVSLVRQTRWHWWEAAASMEDEPVPPQTPFALIETRGWYRHFAGAVCISAAAQCALVAFLTGNRLSAIMFGGTALAVLTWRALDVTPLAVRSVNPWFQAARKMAVTIAIAFAAVCFCLTPQLRRDASGADIAQALDKLLQALHKLTQSGVTVEPTTRAVKHVPPAALSPDEDYAGVIIFPEAAAHTVLVPPPAAMSRATLAGGQLPRTSSVPFFGSYWLYRAPAHRPPRDSVTLAADPARRGFFTRDRRFLNMEAHQNLGVDVDLACCREIAIWIRNASRHKTWLELILINTQVKRHPRLSLGWKEVGAVPTSATEPESAVIRFPVPRRAPIRRFDEFLVLFHRDSTQTARSARISLDRFVFVP